jgi:hypothetical protein
MGERAVVRASVAPMHAEPRVSSPQISQRLAGHAVTILESDGDWLRVRGDDAYPGWMHGGYLDLTVDRAASGAARVLSLGCRTRDPATTRSRSLPLGAWLAPGEGVTGGEVIMESSRATAFPADARAIAATAVERFAGVPYQWGGVSPWGADCSGLVQTVFWLHGLQLPRDAWQQAELGSDAGHVVADWQAADLLFFTDRADRRITHVGIALGDARMVHLALGRGGYWLERLDPADDTYVASLVTRFVSARRLV